MRKRSKEGPGPTGCLVGQESSLWWPQHTATLSSAPRVAQASTKPFASLSKHTGWFQPIQILNQFLPLKASSGTRGVIDIAPTGSSHLMPISPGR